MKILVIGSEGNIGRQLVKYLRKSGHFVIRSDIKPEHAADYYQADIVHPGDLMPAIRKYDFEVIYNLAAMVSRVTCEAAPVMTMERNLVGTNNVIQIAKHIGAKLVVFSTSEVYGNHEEVLSEDSTLLLPNNRYGLSKQISEMITRYEVEMCGLDAVIVRPFMFYSEDEDRGSHRSAMIRFAQTLWDGGEVEVHTGTWRSWMHMDDAVIALEGVAHLKEFDIINIGNPEVVPTTEIAKMFCDIYGRDYAEHVREVELPSQMTRVKIPFLEKQRRLLGFEPTVPVAEGVQRVARRIMRGGK